MIPSYIRDSSAAIVVYDISSESVYLYFFISVASDYFQEAELIIYGNRYILPIVCELVARSVSVLSLFYVLYLIASCTMKMGVRYGDMSQN